ncbi:hypothetical protein K437DRAFT_275180 [Tilletiaria anomala UBC 951]|uniref:BCD1 alpha/beta domain-containing protein n=1 Tax=Tilletiaria anomala (strain ATCC 24038 / CBS 436.72 / UBC 951) TaxID=1037660 RepID=A0A066VQ79_TILAU|nr:uncharacterized protein K437DRAFT_275180 [Tilletiaria anomala UBC 951]KDN42413.1 hypothetical protein K437DRAFT_275180 [Tilletiaria anomala UBC 951]
MPAATSSVCVECKEKAGRYKCPVCHQQGITCSLTCSKAHKENAHASSSNPSAGPKLSRGSSTTAVVASQPSTSKLGNASEISEPTLVTKANSDKGLYELNQDSLLSDYLFLSHMSRNVSSIGRALASEQWADGAIKASKLQTHAGPAAAAELALSQKEAEERLLQMQQQQDRRGAKGKRKLGDGAGLNGKRLTRNQERRELLAKQCRYLRLPILFLPEGMGLAKSNRSTWLRRESQMEYTVEFRTRAFTSSSKENEWKATLHRQPPEANPVVCLLEHLESHSSGRIAKPSHCGGASINSVKKRIRGKRDSSSASKQHDQMLESGADPGKGESDGDGDGDGKQGNSALEAVRGDNLRQDREWQIEDDAWLPILRDLHGWSATLNIKDQQTLCGFLESLPAPTPISPLNNKRLRLIKPESLRGLFSLCVPLTRVALRNESSQKHLEWYERQRAKGAIDKYTPFLDTAAGGSSEKQAEVLSAFSRKTKPEETEEQHQRWLATVPSGPRSMRATNQETSVAASDSSLVNTGLLQKLSAQMKALSRDQSLPPAENGCDTSDKAHVESINISQAWPLEADAKDPAAASSAPAPSKSASSRTLLRVPILDTNEPSKGIQELLQHCPSGYGVVEYPIFEIWLQHDLDAAVHQGLIKLLNFEKGKKASGERQDGSESSSDGSGSESEVDSGSSSSGSSTVSSKSSEIQITSERVTATAKKRALEPASVAPESARKTAKWASGPSVALGLGHYGSDTDSDSEAGDNAAASASNEAKGEHSKVETPRADLVHPATKLIGAYAESTDDDEEDDAPPDGETHTTAHAGLASLAQQLGFAPPKPPSPPRSPLTTPTEREGQAEPGVEGGVFAEDSLIWSDEE